MESRNFVDEFNISNNNEEFIEVTDQDRLKNKELLDLLRN